MCLPSRAVGLGQRPWGRLDRRSKPRRQGCRGGGGPRTLVTRVGGMEGARRPFWCVVAGACEAPCDSSRVSSAHCGVHGPLELCSEESCCSGVVRAVLSDSPPSGCKMKGRLGDDRVDRLKTDRRDGVLSSSRQEMFTFRSLN